MSVQDQERALLQVVDDYRLSECRRLYERAREEAARLLRQARAEARARVHRGVVREREIAAASIRAAQAALDARRRISAQHRNRALLAAVWPRLESSLRRRWATAEGRRAWVDAALEQALRQLPAAGWTVRHPRDWPRGEQELVEQRLAQRLADTPSFREDAALAAGLVIESGAASLDATLEGLLADRQKVESRMLALLDTEGSS